MLSGEEGSCSYLVRPPTERLDQDSSFGRLLGAGRVSQTTNPSRQNPADGLGYATTYGYDSLGRPTSVTTPDGLTAATSYAGNKTTVSDQAGKSLSLPAATIDAGATVYWAPVTITNTATFVVELAASVTFQAGSSIR